MRHDSWPPLPPVGQRAPDAPPFASPGDQLLAVGLGATAGAGALVWATGQAAGLAFGHTWLEMSPADVAHILWHLPQHWGDPALAWLDGLTLVGKDAVIPDGIEVGPQVVIGVGASAADFASALGPGARIADRPATMGLL